MRDWSKTLWPASFKGVPFYVQSDKESGKRRIVSHEFPMRDDPFHEDLGEGIRSYDVTAYIASDFADTQGQALLATCAQRGAGLLVLPINGPVQVKCETFERSHEKDRLGYIAFSLKFLREGALTALISSGFLQQQVISFASTLALSASSAFEVLSFAKDQPDFVVEAGVHEIENALTVLETVRVSSPVDPVVSASLRDTLIAFFSDAPQLFSRTNGADAAFVIRFFDATLALNDGLPDASASDVIAPLLDQFAPVIVRGFEPIYTQRASANINAVRLCVRMALMAAYADGVIRRSYTDRPQGLNARALASMRFEYEMDMTVGAESAELFRDLATLRGLVMDFFTRTIVDLAPVIEVKANAPLPAIVHAWRLYSDPLRAGELVARNNVPHPAFMPPTFEALAR
jgi:prophage DNA circulation protein